MERGTTTVLIVDDHRSFADAVALTIDTQSDLRCSGTAGTAEEALVSIEAATPDVVLVDIGLPDVDGITLTTQIKTQRPDARVLILTGSTDPIVLAMAARAGADGFLRKDQALAEVLEAIRDPDGQLLTSRQMLGVIVRDEGNGTGAEQVLSDMPSLTDREFEVLARLAQGEPVKTIARELDISIFTCRGHVRSILEKLEVHSQLAAVLRAGRLGLLPAEGA